MMNSPRRNNPIVDETFAVGTFYRLIGHRENGVCSAHAIGDGTAVATITIEHCDMPVNIDGTSLIPTEPGAAAPGWGLKGAATTVGASDARLWQPDAAIGTLSIAATTGVTGGARVSWGNQKAVYTRAKIVVTTAGRIMIAGADSR